MLHYIELPCSDATFCVEHAGGVRMNSERERGPTLVCGMRPMESASSHISATRSIHAARSSTRRGLTSPDMTSTSRVSGGASSSLYYKIDNTAINGRTPDSFNLDAGTKINYIFRKSVKCLILRSIPIPSRSATAYEQTG